MPNSRAESKIDAVAQRSADAAAEKNDNEAHRYGSIGRRPSLSSSAMSRSRPGLGVVEKLRPVEDRIGAGEEAQRLRLLAHVLAPGGEPHHRLRHGDARDRDGAHELERIELLRRPASGVPSTCTSMLIGTLSGCTGRLASVAIMPARSSAPSPMPTMPPQQTLMPASRTAPSVSSRSW